MARYIDADALGIGYANPKVFNSEEYARGWNSAIDIINSAPTLSPDDLRGVGEWRDKVMSVPGGHGQTYHRYGCTRCKAKVKVKTPYCPSCGAKMKGE